MKTTRHKNRKRAHLRILNPTNSEIHIKSNTVIALVTQVDINNIFELSDSENDVSVNSVSHETPNQTKQTSKINLNIHNVNLNKKQVSKLNNFLQQNRDVFAIHWMKQLKLMFLRIELKLRLMLNQCIKLFTANDQN